MSVGVYKMTFTGTDEFYIGSTGVSFNHRWHRHNLDLEAKRHKNRIVQNYYNKYGQPKFEVIENIKKFNGSVFKTLKPMKPGDCNVPSGPGLPVSSS